MVRLIVWILILIIGYKLIKTATSSFKTNKKVNVSTPGQIADVMLQDPYCKAYFPKNQGVIACIRQKEIYFCSTECKEAFMDQLDPLK